MSLHENKIGDKIAINIANSFKGEILAYVYQFKCKLVKHVHLISKYYFQAELFSKIKCYVSKICLKVVSN